ncbi:MAG: hypothetical protein GF308_20520 [Candidatus Heimdallarchaeota archaeon]|nr:hypothetical protein [Candidatus Heimdallarchaeota archaeon]
MAALFSWIIVGVVALLICFGLIGLIQWLRYRWRREKSGDIFLLKREGRGGEPPVELRGERDYRYKDAGVDPYEDPHHKK